MTVSLYFTFILLTGALAGYLAWYAWRQRDVPGSRAYAGLALNECLLALADLLSMVSPTPGQALFWFQVRYAPIALISVFWLVFALEYSGRKDVLSPRLWAGLFVVPAITQVLLWSNGRSGLWAQREVDFHRHGPFWLADISVRLPGLGFLTHAFYGLILLLIGIALLLLAAWRTRRLDRGQALLVAAAASIAFVMAAVTAFRLIPCTEFNPFTLGLGLSVLLIALATFRFQFLQRAPAAETPTLAGPVSSSLGVFLLIFVMLTTGLAALGSLSYQNFKRQFRAQVESQLASIAALKVEELQGWRHERLADARIYFQNPAFHALVQRMLANPADASARAELQAWLKVLMAHRQYDRIFLLDERGVVRISFPASPEPAPARLTQELAAMLSTEQVTFLDFHRDSATGPIHLSLLVPLLSEPEDRPLGLLVLRVNPRLHLYPCLRQWPVPSASAETLLVRREGNEVLFLNDLKFRMGAAFTFRLPLENTAIPAVRAALGQEGLVEGIDYRGVPVVAQVRAVPGTPWFLVAKVDTAEVYAPLQERLWLSVVVFGALMVASGACLGLIWRHQSALYYRGQAEAAQALRESWERFRDLYENAPNAYFSVGMDGCIRQCNRRAGELLGLEVEELVGRPVLDLYADTPQGKEKAAKILDRFRAGETVRDEELQMRRADGSPVWISLTVNAVRDAQGQVVESRSMVMDITERKQAEAEIQAAQAELQRLLAEAERSRLALLSVLEDQKKAEEGIRQLNVELEKRVRERTAQLEAINRELEAFAYSVSHDLRAPLRALDGFSAVLRSRYAEQLDEQGQHYLDRIQAASQRMGQLIDDLLNLSRVTRSEFTRQRVDLSALARAIAPDLQAQEPQRPAEFVIAEGLVAEGDARLLRLALENLLGNAWKFTRTRPLTRVEVGVVERAGERVYFVRDNGVGFDPAYADKLFAPFQRLHSLSEFPGTGIGLATVQRIIRRHGGRIWPEAAVDQGATFYFTLGGT